MMRRQIAQFTKAVKEYCSCQGVLCFTFVQTDLNSAAGGGVQDFGAIRG